MTNPAPCERCGVFVSAHDVEVALAPAGVVIAREVVAIQVSLDHERLARAILVACPLDGRLDVSPHHTILLRKALIESEVDRCRHVRVERVLRGRPNDMGGRAVGDREALSCCSGGHASIPSVLVVEP